MTALTAERTQVKHDPRSYLKSQSIYSKGLITGKVYIIQPTFRKMDGVPVKGFSLASCPLELPQLSGAVPAGWEKKCSHEFFDDIDYDYDADVVFITAPTNDILHAAKVIKKFRAKVCKVIFGGFEDDFSEEILSKVADSYYYGIPGKEDMAQMLNDAIQNKLRKRYEFGLNFNYPYDYSVYKNKQIFFI